MKLHTYLHPHTVLGSETILPSARCSSFKDAVRTQTHTYRSSGTNFLSAEASVGKLEDQLAFMRRYKYKDVNTFFLPLLNYVYIGVVMAMDGRLDVKLGQLKFRQLSAHSYTVEPQRIRSQLRSSFIQCR